MDKPKESKALDAITGFGDGLAILKFVPGLAPIGEGADFIVKAFEKIESARIDRRVKSLETLVRCVGYQLKGDALPKPPEESKSLILHVIEAAIGEDEERKQPIYAALVVWVCREKPAPPLVRALNHAVRTLSFDELARFISTARRKEPYHTDLADGMNGDVVTARLISVALITQAETWGQEKNISPIGAALIHACEGVDLSGLPDANLDD